MYTKQSTYRSDVFQKQHSLWLSISEPSLGSLKIIYLVLIYLFLKGLCDPHTSDDTVNVNRISVVTREMPQMKMIQRH